MSVISESIKVKYSNESMIGMIDGDFKNRVSSLLNNAFSIDLLLLF